ncbi:Aspartyl/Asparaginyl beta-hydroxylase [Streptomyces sp. 1222.5]|uniref:aspartyl/asparaginyl beta-hydroxylase domain-containing protein n=1 Tax=unclassified Streptomyces TaxID=2593676 RepID=UPI0008967BA7|nr:MULTISPECIES: aspartyl/asparaginyl beta-hydroxylase domain-containing protein [unclassified Streptomyces]PKW00401.1 aspartyl/asparaginyl beta-hydroxylase [Streptomyces sp. 5112.2]SED87090.1 Aspartyl/Asparaginyl beta-hydroxylase [Streptomyces sp. 1222.5]
MSAVSLSVIDPELVELVPGLRFSHDKIVEAYQQYLERVPLPASGNAEDRFRRLGLTHRANAEDPWRDAGNGQFNQATGEKNFEESEFCEFNEELKDTYFYEIYKNLPFRPGRMRLVTLHPGEIYHMHTDASRVAHMAIQTNEDSRLLFRSGHTYHVPTDGRIHILNTIRHHSAYNAGGTDRIHLTMTLAD